MRPERQTGCTVYGGDMRKTAPKSECLPMRHRQVSVNGACIHNKQINGLSVESAVEKGDA